MPKRKRPTTSRTITQLLSTLLQPSSNTKSVLSSLSPQERKTLAALSAVSREWIDCDQNDLNNVRDLDGMIIEELVDPYVAMMTKWGRACERE